MSDNKLSLKSVIKDIAKKQQLSVSTANFKNKTAEALHKAGFSQTRAKAISQGMRTGTSKLSNRQTENVIRAMVKGKVIKPISDVKGTISRFGSSQEKQKAAEVTQDKIKERRLKENLRRQADETIKEIKEEREAGKKEYSSTKEKQSVSINYRGSGIIKKTVGPAFSADFQNLPSDFEAPPAPSIQPQEAGQVKPDEEVQSLINEAEKHDLPID